MEAPPQFYTTEEVAKILHLHTKTVRELIVKKKLGAIKVGTEYRISQEHLRKFIEENQV